MSEKVRNICLITLVIIDVITLFSFLIAGALDAPAVGNVIDELFLKNIRYERILHYVNHFCLIAFLFLAAATVVLFISKQVQLAVKAYIAVGAMCLMGFALLFVMASKCLPVMMNEAHVVTAAITDSRYYYHKGSHSYYLEFGEYGEIGVTELEYDETDIGDTYYLICCGDEMIKACHPSLYTLEVSTSNNSGHRR